MKILYASDTHVHPAHFSRLLHAADEILPDAIVVGGDINPNWRSGIGASIEPHRQWIRERLLPAVSAFRERHPGIMVLLDLGNDDIAAASLLLEEQDGKDLRLLHMKVLKLDARLAVAGYMAVNPTPFAIKDREKRDCRDISGLAEPGVASRGWVTMTGIEEPVDLAQSDSTIEDDLEDLSRAMDDMQFAGCSFIFVSHAPPRYTALDLTGQGSHVGSLAVRRFIENWSSRSVLTVSLHGHIHESPWESGRVWDRVGDIPCFNVGQKRSPLRALLFDSESPLDSARLVLVEASGEISVEDLHQSISH